MQIKVRNYYSHNKRSEKLNYGILTFKNKKLVSFKEKPKIEMNVGMGIYGVNKNIISKNLLKKVKKIDFNEVFEKENKIKNENLNL